MPDKLDKPVVSRVVISLLLIGPTSCKLLSGKSLSSGDDLTVIEKIASDIILLPRKDQTHGIAST